MVPTSFSKKNLNPRSLEKHCSAGAKLLNLSVVLFVVIHDYGLVFS